MIQLPQMSFFDAVKTVYFKKYCCFKGRARRSEFWWSYLAYYLASLLVYFLAIAFWGLIKAPFVTNPFALVLFLPNLGVQVRRLHDIGRSGWWLLGYCCIVGVLALMGSAFTFLGITKGYMLLVFTGILAMLSSFGIMVYYLVLLCKDSQPVANAYGPSPKYVEEEQEAEASAPQAEEQAPAPEVAPQAEPAEEPLQEPASEEE